MPTSLGPCILVTTSFTETRSSSQDPVHHHIAGCTSLSSSTPEVQLVVFTTFLQRSGGIQLPAHQPWALHTCDACVQSDPVFIIDPVPKIAGPIDQYLISDPRGPQIQSPIESTSMESTVPFTIDIQSGTAQTTSTQRHSFIDNITPPACTATSRSEECILVHPSCTCGYSDMFL